MNPAPLEQQQLLWSDASTAAAVMGVLGHDAGGVLLRARAGPVRDLWLSEARRLQEPGHPWRKVPLLCGTDRLLGGLDLTSTLRSGRPVASSGLLAECDGGVAVLPMAERAEGSLLAALASALDTGEIHLEREGVTAISPARFALVALDEGVDADELVDATLAERLGFQVDLNAVSLGACEEFPWTRRELKSARLRLDATELPHDRLEALCRASLALGVASPRAVLLAARAARAHAALYGRLLAEDADLEFALRLVLLPRATQLPASDESQEHEEEQPPEQAPPPDSPPDTPPDAEADAESEPAPDLPVERLLDAARAALPDALLEQLVAAALRRSTRRGGGKSGATQRHKLRGRPMGSIAGDPRSGARLDLIATLRAAAPWQKLRTGKLPGARSGGGSGGVTARSAIAVESSDYRVVRFRQRTQSVTVFVVDASGSAALYRLAEAKGAVELLLADCYVRRDEVALIAFRGERAEVLLPPTRSLVRAKRCLSALPGGGGTPLASAIDTTALLLQQIERRGATPSYVMLTDGRANIARDGSSGREAASGDATSAAMALRLQSQAAGMVIDTSPRPHRSAAQLAEALGALYLPLPHADASQLQAAVRGVAA